MREAAQQMRRPRGSAQLGLTSAFGSLIMLACAACASQLAGGGSSPGGRFFPGPRRAAWAATGAWPYHLTCGDRLPSRLPPSGDGIYRLAAGPVSRSADGRPSVPLSLHRTPWHGPGVATGPAYMFTATGPRFRVLEPSPVVMLVVRGDLIIAVGRLPRPLPDGGAPIPMAAIGVREADLRRYAPRVTLCEPETWEELWQHPHRYRVIVLMSLWYGWKLPSRLSAEAPIQQRG
jgi:hypothetical protein